jgi:peptidoglycan DL-endopeptidase CwlO
MFSNKLFAPNQTKNSTTMYKKIRKKIQLAAATIGAALLLMQPVIVHAASSAELQRQIDSLNAEIERKQGTLNGISSQANTLQNKLDLINGEIAAIDDRIAKANLEIEQTNAKIAETTERLEKQKRIMFENARALYKQGDLSTIEILASSDNFSEFVNRQEYLETVKKNVNEAAREIVALKEELEKNLEKQRNIVAEAEIQRRVQASKQAEQANLVAQTRGEEAAYQRIVSSDQSRVNELRSQQAAINRASQSNVSFGGTGSYPWANAPWPNEIADPWGMYQRQCVSYTAWKVAASGKHMPYWGGSGNANEWPGNAQAAGIPTGSQPRPGAVAVSMAGTYGHTMYVERINGNGTIRVSQYNAGWDGRYSEADVSPGGLVFIYF